MQTDTNMHSGNLITLFWPIVINRYVVHINIPLFMFKNVLKVSQEKRTEEEIKILTY